MNILVLNWRDIKHPEGGGAEVHLLELFGRLVGYGHTVTLITTRFHGSAQEDTMNGIRVIRWGSTYVFNWQAPFLIRRFMKNNPVDVIVDDVNKIPFFSPLYFSSTPTAVFFHHLFGQTVFKLAAWPFATYVLVLERLSGIFYRKTPCCTVSPSTKSELCEIGFDPQHVTIIENSVDTTLYSYLPDVQKESDLLLYTGRLKIYKNVAILLDALKILRDRGRTLRLAIAGAGDDEMALRKKADALGISNLVTFYGFVSENEKIDLYRRAALFVNPSMKEGWGITNIEANACGTAVVANNVPGIWDAVKNGETGILYRENSIEDLIASIENVLDDEQLRNTLIKNGLRWASTFSWDSNAKKVENWLWKTVLKK